MEHQHEDGAQQQHPRSFTIRKYNAVVQSAELVDIRLSFSKFNVKSEYFLVKSAEKGENRSIMKHIVDGVLSWSQYDGEEGLLIGEFEWSASSRKGRKKLLEVHSKYLVVYVAAKDLEEECVEAFLSNVGRFATFPYFRSLVAGYGAASSADLPILPILKQPIQAVAESDTDPE